MTGTDTLLVPAEGTHNLREIGGHPAAGGAVRKGKLYRSDALHRLTPGGRRTLEATGIRLIVDLRSDDEVVNDPTMLSEEMRIVRAPIFTGDSRLVRLGDADVTLSRIYDLMIDQRGAQLTEAVRHIARSGETPVLVHCTAGKDRTGIVVALALLASGVDKDAVIADYAQTSTNLAGPWVQQQLGRMQVAGIPVTPEVQELVTASPADEMARLIQRWESEWGSAAGYLTTHGLTADDLEALGAALIDMAATR